MEGEGDGDGVSVELIQNIIKLLTCPICEGIQSGPRYLCMEGHATCNQCREVDSTCPECNARVSGFRNLLAENLAEKLCGDCKYSRFGCTTLLPEEQRKLHEGTCPFRPLKCPLVKPNSNELCDQEFDVDSYLGHLLNDHSLQPYTTDVVRQSFPFDLSKTTDLERKSLPPTIAFTDSKILVTWLETSSMYWWVYQLDAETKGGEMIKLTLQNPNTKVAASFLGPLHSFQKSGIEVSNSGLCLALTLSGLKAIAAFDKTKMCSEWNLKIDYKQKTSIVDISTADVKPPFISASTSRNTQNETDDSSSISLSPVKSIPANDSTISQGPSFGESLPSMESTSSSYPRPEESFPAKKKKKTKKKKSKTKVVVDTAMSSVRANPDGTSDDSTSTMIYTESSEVTKTGNVQPKESNSQLKQSISSVLNFCKEYMDSLECHNEPSPGISKPPANRNLFEETMSKKSNISIPSQPSSSSRASSSSPRKFTPGSRNNSRTELHRSEDAWIPSFKHGTNGIASNEASHEVLVKKARGILNRLSIENFDKSIAAFIELKIEDEYPISHIVYEIFERVIQEPAYSCMLAQFIKNICDKCVLTSKKFRKRILDLCQKEFQECADRDTHIRAMEEALSKIPTNEAVAFAKEMYDKKAIAKKRSLGVVRFIAEIYKLNMLTPRIIIDCINIWLVNGDEDNLECLGVFMTTSGQKLDRELKQMQGREANIPGAVISKFIPPEDFMNKTFVRLASLSTDEGLSQRIRFALQNLVELRQAGWSPQALGQNKIPSPVNPTVCKPSTSAQAQIETKKNIGNSSTQGEQQENKVKPDEGSTVKTRESQKEDSFSRLLKQQKDLMRAPSTYDTNSKDGPAIPSSSSVMKQVNAAVALLAPYNLRPKTPEIVLPVPTIPTPTQVPQPTPTPKATSVPKPKTPPKPTNLKSHSKVRSIIHITGAVNAGGDMVAGICTVRNDGSAVECYIYGPKKQDVPEKAPMVNLQAENMMCLIEAFEEHFLPQSSIFIVCSSELQKDGINAKDGKVIELHKELEKRIAQKEIQSYKVRCCKTKPTTESIAAVCLVRNDTTKCEALLDKLVS